MTAPLPRKKLMARKSIEALQHEARVHGLKRSLSVTNLLSLGIGCILGAGIYVMTGTAAANYAGPAVVLSFVIAGMACALTAFCYGELSSTMPVSGSAYTYCYATIGEAPAWLLGWLILLEYGLAAALLAVGFSGYLVSLLGDFGVIIPAAWSTPAVQSVVTPTGTDFIYGGGLNVIAALVICAVTALLSIGITESALVNNIMVIIKILVLCAFVAAGIHWVNPGNWEPFIPQNRGGFTYGWAGVFRGASMLFFAYIGFETVSTAAAEAKNPQRDIPIAILGALGVCTAVYIAVAAVMTGIVPYSLLGVPDPVALAVDHMNMPGFAVLIKFGALTGLGSVLLVNAYGQSRIGFAMGRDHLLPEMFCQLHSRFKTPYLGTILFGLISMIMAALLPISLVGDLISLGIALAFSIVSICVMWLRTTRPDLDRPFRVPLGGVWIKGVWFGYIPVAAILFAWAIIIPVLVDIVNQALNGDIIPASILGTYATAGIIIYAAYGRHRAAAAAAADSI